MNSGISSAISGPGGGSSGGGGDDTPLIDVLNSHNPFGVWRSDNVVETDGSISRITDQSGNGRHLDDAQASSSRAQLLTGAIETSEGARSVLAQLASGTIPRDFHAFIVLEAGADLLAESGDTAYFFAPQSGSNLNYSWLLPISSGDWTSYGGMASSARVDFDPDIDASKKILVEVYYIGSKAKQGGRVNGFDGWTSFGTFPESGFTWSGLRLGTTNSASFAENIRFFDFAMFDITSGPLSYDAYQEIIAAFHRTYTDTQTFPRIQS